MAEVSTTVLQPMEVDLTSPKRSNADSDSDSTSTELCDEPDRLSDVDSEDLTSASESYVMATDEEKSSRLESSPMPEKLLKGTSLDESVKSIKIKDIKASDDSLNDISIAQITDQIRRLSAEDDNNSMVPQTFSAQSKVSLDDSTMKAYSPEIEKSVPDLVVDYVSDADSVRKSLALAKYDYLSFTSSTVSTKEDEVLVHERHRPKEAIKEVEEVSPDDTKQRHKVKDTVPKIVRQESSTVFPEYSSPLERKYDTIIDSITVDLGTENVERFKTSFDFSSKLSLEKSYESSKPSSLISDTSTTIANAERTLYSKTYIGHLPISPLTVDQKLSKPIPIIHGANSVVGLSSEISTTAEVSSEKEYLGDRAQAKVYSDLKKSPKTPESSKSFSSGETDGT